MDIMEMNIEDLKPYENNPRFNDNAVDKVAESIKQFGFKVPIVIDANNEIIAGHTRLKAAKELGLEKVPCIIADDLTPEQVKAFRLADNKVAEFADWDFNLLNLELEELELDFDMAEFGFDEEEFDNIMGIDKEAEEDDFEAEPPENPISKRGDIYQLGKHRLMCGDATTDVGLLMDGKKVDMIYTDPPYGMFLDADYSDMESKFKGSTGGNKYDKVIGDNEDFKPELITTIFDNFRDVKEVFIWGSDYFSELLENRNAGSWIVWDKRGNADGTIEDDESSDKMFGSTFELCWSKARHKRLLARVKWAGIFGLEKEFDKKRQHPTQKPIGLSSWFLERFSDTQDIIVDLYGGSGSTLIACEQLDRICYMMELDEKYVDVIVNRYITFKEDDSNVYLIRDGVKIPYSEVEKNE